MTKLVTIALLVAGLTLAACGTISPRVTTGAPPEGPSQSAPQAAPARQPGVGADNLVVEVYERVGPAVVNITTTAEARDVLGRPRQAEGTGSGFIIDHQGHVVTNHHVVGGATRLDVTLADNTSYVGELVTADSANDLAVIRIRAPEDKLQQLAVAPLGDSSALKVGQTVVAIGNPFGLERSASLGIVSSVGRTRPGETQRFISNMIQTDAAINPGNSGGPLLNLQGEVIGINEQIQAPTRGNVGVGFAIPVNTLKRYLPDLLAGREPQHAWMGVSGAPLTPTIAEQLKAPVQQGVLLSTVAPTGPAGRAGLRGAGRGDPASADIITQIDTQPVRGVEDVATYVDSKEPGDRVRVTFVRGGQRQEVEVTLGTWEAVEGQAR
jgi:S1-C subfamily serine protease